MMKKALSLLLVLAMVVVGFTACIKDNAPVEPEKPAEESVMEEEMSQEEIEITTSSFAYPGGVRTGMAVVTTVAKSTPVADDKNGKASTDSLVVAVLTDNDGRIVSAVIDTVQTEIEFSGEGKIVTPLTETVQSKQEKKDSYGMKAASGIEKEWYEQANALSDYVVGKTLEELKTIAVDEKTVPTDVDLSANVTIKIGAYIDAISQAIISAQELGATPEDQLGLAIVTNIKKSKNADGETAGVAQTYSTYAVATVNREGVITTTLLDASQANVEFDGSGTITTNLDEPVYTKNEKGASYGMKGASSIGAEWDAQAKVFADYTEGKTIAEVTGITVTEGVPTNTDLVASVTIGITDFTAAIEKAVANATSGQTAESAATTIEEVAPVEEAKAA